VKLSINYQLHWALNHLEVHLGNSLILPPLKSVKLTVFFIKRKPELQREDTFFNLQKICYSFTYHHKTNRR